MMKPFFYIAMVGSAILATSCSTGQGRVDYPETARDTTVVDDYFGTKVADPFRWLENDTSAATEAWVKAENAVTDSYLEKIPFRAALRERMSQLFNYEKMGVPFKRNGKYYTFRNTGLQNQSVLYVQDSLGGEARVVLDPNKLSDDGTVALATISFSDDGKYMAYTISRSGSDWNEIYVMNLADGSLLDDHIVWAKFTSVEWLGDGFYYSGYDAPKDAEKAYSTKNEYHKVFYHKLGTPQSADRIEYQGDSPLMFYSAQVEDNRYLLMYPSDGENSNILIKDTKQPGAKYRTVVGGMDCQCGVVGIDTDRNVIYVYTNKDAAMGKLEAYDLRTLKLKKTILLEKDEMLVSVIPSGKDNFIVEYEKDAYNRAYVYDREGNMLNEIELPIIGSASFVASSKHDEVFYAMSSFTVPGFIYTYDKKTNVSTEYWRPSLDIDLDEYVTEQVPFTSKDGTTVRMFLTYKKGLERNGKTPVLLYGYGGFNISLTPSFNPRNLPFIENGGIFASVNLRGGSEYGEQWHQAGTKMNKQNVFDDFIAAAEYLISEGYTCPEKLACNGGSNGGLLIGAVVNQRPDLFAAAVPQVGVMDMLRYHQFTIGWNWAGDYGRSDDSKEMFEYLRGYSPLHNVKDDGTVYPAILVTTADHDDRVVPAHSFKYAATLQASNIGPKPHLIRIDSKAGHGGGKPVSKVIDEYTDIYSFILYNMGESYTAPAK